MASLQKFLEYHVKGLIHCLHLENYEIFVVYEKDSSPIMEIDVDNPEMKTSFIQGYLEASITYGRQIKQLWANKQRAYIVKCLTHEVCHLIVGIRDIPYDKKTEVQIRCTELAVEHVGRIAYRLYVRWLDDQPPDKAFQIPKEN